MCYQIVYADPPWSDQVADGEGAGEDANFDADMLALVKDLSVGERVADNALLFLWVPSSLLPVGLSVLEAWGFRYGYTWTWRVPPVGEGEGYWHRGRCEQLLVGVRGSIDLSVLKSDNLFDAAPDGEHRPEYFRFLAAETGHLVFGGGTKLDLFGSYWKARYPEYHVEDWRLWEEKAYAESGLGDGEL